MIESETRDVWERDGVFLARDVFDAATVAALEADFDRIVDQLIASNEPIDATWSTADRVRRSRQALLHTHNVHSYSSRWLRALLDDRFLDITETCLGPDLILHHSKLFLKPAGAGSPFPMHQDWRYFPTTGDRMIAAIVHLSAATIDGGCVWAYPGSHRLGRMPSTSGSPDYDDPDEFRRFTERYPIEGATPYEANPGDVLFFSCLTVHGSGPNVSPAPRKTVLVQVFAGAAELEDSDHPVSELVLRGWNHHATRDRVAVSASRVPSQSG